MYITTTTSKGIAYVRLMESVWDKQKQRGVNKVVQSFGRLDDLIKDNPNALEELKAKYRDESTAIAARKKTRQKQLAEEITQLEAAELDKKDYQDLNFSIYPVGCIWKELGLDYKINKIKSETKIEFDVNRTVLHAAVMRIVDPQSHHYNWTSQNCWMGTMANPLQLHHFYRSLDFLEDNRDELMGWINNKLTESGRDLSLVYYDTTNFWVETPWDDNEWECIRAARREGKTFVEKMLEGLVDKDALRMKGLSKERRSDMPLVSVALIVDKEGIPVDFRVYAGNKSEKTEMLESIKRLKETYGIKRCIIVADRGLNTIENLVHIEDGGHQFMVAQSIAQLPEHIRNEICKKDGWIGNDDDTVRYKEIELPKKSQSGDLERNYRLVVSLSASRLAHDKNAIELDWELANKAVKEQRKLYEKRPGWAKYVKFKNATDKADDKNDAKDAAGNNKKSRKSKKEKPKIAYELDYDAYRKALAIAGMYGIVTDIPNKSPENPNGMTAKEIFSKQRELLKIEECFRVMKSTLELRPINVRNKKRIRGHVMLCVVALIILRLLEKKLKQAGTPMSTSEISNYLEKATVRSGGEMGSMTFRPVFVPLVKDRSVNLRFKGDDNADAVDLIMKATGLIPIEKECDRNGLARCLRTRFATDEEVLGFKSGDPSLEQNDADVEAPAAPPVQVPLEKKRIKAKASPPVMEVSFKKELPAELQQKVSSQLKRELPDGLEGKPAAEPQQNLPNEIQLNEIQSNELQQKLPADLQQNLPREKQPNEVQQKASTELKQDLPNGLEQKLLPELQQDPSIKPKRKLASKVKQDLPNAPKQEVSLELNQDQPPGPDQDLPNEIQQKLPNELKRKSASELQQKRQNEIRKKLSTEPKQKLPNDIEPD